MSSVLCIAGLDPSGYAGLSADLHALNYLGITGLPIASVLTVQSLNTFSELQPVPAKLISKQLKAVLIDREPGAIKIGMLGSADNARLVADFLDGGGIPSVVDPVFASSSGFRFIDKEMLDVYINELVPVSDLVTPNAHEASILTGIKVDDLDSAELACSLIMDMGTRSVLVKGGHFTKSIGADVFCDSSGPYRLKGTGKKHKERGTGCTYSTLIAGHLAKGQKMLEAVKKAKHDMAKVMEFSNGQPEKP